MIEIDHEIFKIKEPETTGKEIYDFLGFDTGEKSGHGIGYIHYLQNEAYKEFLKEKNND